MKKWAVIILSGDLIILTILAKSGSKYEIYNLVAIMNIFIMSSCDPYKNGKQATWGSRLPG